MLDKQKIVNEQIKWWKDKKLLAGIALVLMSVILGFYGKSLLGLFIANLIRKLYEPIYLFTGLSVYALSWILLLLGIFLVGWETVKMIQYKIHHHVKKTVVQTYHHAKELPKKGYNYTKEFHKKFHLRVPAKALAFARFRRK